MEDSSRSQETQAEPVCAGEAVHLILPLAAQLVKSPPAKWETWVPSLAWEDPLEKGKATHSSIFAGKSHGQRSLVGYSPWGHKESD